VLALERPVQLPEPRLDRPPAVNVEGRSVPFGKLAERNALTVQFPVVVAERPRHVPPSVRTRPNRFFHRLPAAHHTAIGRLRRPELFEREHPDRRLRIFLDLALALGRAAPPRVHEAARVFDEFLELAVLP